MIDFEDGIRLRPIEAGDGAGLAAAYDRNRAHLARWDPTRDESFYTAARQESIVEKALQDRVADRVARFVLTAESGTIMGVANIMNIVRGASESADLGYWIDATLAGRGTMSAVIATLVDFAHDDLGLHRLQASTLHDNIRSQGVLKRNGFEQIGMAPKYLRIAGEWQDHVLFQRILFNG